VAILAQPTPDTVLLVRQYRYPVRRWTWEIPAGTRVPGEEPSATARRELQEEAGYTSAAMVELMRFFPALGVSDEEMILYRATGLQMCTTAPEHGELVSPDIVALTDVAAYIADGRICDAKTLIALTLLGR
jgi:ADP-ribose pyrophosphatase